MNRSCFARARPIEDVLDAEPTERTVIILERLASELRVKVE